MIQNVTFTMTSTGTGILWLFLLTIILSFTVAHFKCKNYNCSIKYSLLIGIIMAIIYSIIFILTIPAFPPEVRNTPLFNLILAVILIVIAVIPNIIIGIVGGSFAVFLKRPSKIFDFRGSGNSVNFLQSPKSKGITNKEISKRLKKKNKRKDILDD